MYSFINFILTLDTSRGYRLSWQLEVFYGVLGLEHLTSINRSTSKWLAHKSRLVISSFPSLGLVPIFHCVPMTQLSLAFDKPALKIHPLRHSISGMELGNNIWPDAKMYASHSLKLHLIKYYLSPPVRWKFTNREYAFDQVLGYTPSWKFSEVNMPSIKYKRVQTRNIHVNSR